MESTIIETSTTNDDNKTELKYIEPTLDISNVKYDNSYRINKGTLAQLVVSLRDMTERLDIKSNNNVQTKLYPIIKKICTNAYDKYIELCNNVTNDDLNEHAYFLMGPFMNGSFRFPLLSKTERKQYKYAEVGPTLRSILNRIFHAKREVNNRLINGKYVGKETSYQNLNIFLEKYDEYIKELSNEWKTSVYQIRKEENIVCDT